MKTIVIAALMMGTVNAEQLRITVYDKAKVSDQLIETVVVSLRRIFRQSGIEIEWVAGAPGAPEASLMIYEPLRTGHEVELACRARRDIALDILPAAVPGIKKQVLGMALPLTRKGLNVRIYDDHIREAAARESRTYATVLSHAMAHEIGHVLLRSNTHAGRGLMSDVWTGREYDWMGKEALFFTAGDSRKMRATLSSAACSVELTRTRVGSEIRDPELD
jgi:hypothetical protein